MMGFFMVLVLVDNNTLTAFATVLLALIGIIQILVLIGQLYLLRSQKRNQDIEVLEVYRKRWFDYQGKFGCLVYLGRNLGEYYQTLDAEEITKLNSNLLSLRVEKPTIWARDAVRDVSALMSDICIRILQGSLTIQSVYPILGTAILRHSRPLRILLESDYFYDFERDDGTINKNLLYWHKRVRGEIQDWFVYHIGTRRRCLILIDLLWAEAARLQDLSPDDLKTAADAKINSAKKNRLRIEQEYFLLNSSTSYLKAKRLANYLKHSEYKKYFWSKGLSKKKLERLDKEWAKNFSKL